MTPVCMYTYIKRKRDRQTETEGQRDEEREKSKQSMCAFVCVCVCEKERNTERMKEKEDAHKRVSKGRGLSNMLHSYKGQFLTSRKILLVFHFFFLSIASISSD